MDRPRCRGGEAEMGNSILTDIKKLLGIDESYEQFDQDIIIHVNTYLRNLNQIGVGKRGFSISDKNSKWIDFLGDNSDRLDEVKTFVYIKVRLVFDPPTSSYVLASLDKVADELEWRLNVEVDPGMDKVED